MKIIFAKNIGFCSGIKRANLGIVEVKNSVLITKEGRIIKKVKPKDILREFKRELENYY